MIFCHFCMKTDLVSSILSFFFTLKSLYNLQMCFTCSAQECDNNQANHLVADSSLPTTRLDVNDLSLTAFIPKILRVLPRTSSSSSTPPYLHPILPTHLSTPWKITLSSFVPRPSFQLISEPRLTWECCMYWQIIFWTFRLNKCAYSFYRWHMCNSLSAEITLNYCNQPYSIN